MDVLKKFLNFDVDVNVKTQEINKTIYTLGAVAILIIVIYNYTK